MILHYCDISGIAKDEEGCGHCGYVGYERAAFLPTLFGENGEEIWPSPSAMYAMKPERSSLGSGGGKKKKTTTIKTSLNFRKVETILPLLRKVRVTVYVTYGYGEETKLANALQYDVNNGNLCSREAVISWRHADIPTMAEKLGCGTCNGCPASWAGGQLDFDLG